MSPPASARFYADPSKVRVAFRPHNADWLVCISSRVTGVKVSTLAKDPEAGVLLTLLRAATLMDGIDLDLNWAYYHPQSTEPHE